MIDDVGTAQRALALLDLGRPAEAERLFRHALAADPANADLLGHLSRAVLAQERYAEARDLARQTLASDPEDLNGLLVLSAASAGLKEFPTAVSAVDRALQIAPGHPAIHRQKGAVLIAQDRAEEALAPLERARTLDPEDAQTLAAIGAAYLDLRRYSEAEHAIVEALRLDPDNVQAHQNRGLLELRRGGGRSAVEAHRSALRLDPTDEYSREGLAIAMKSRNPLYGQFLRFGDWVNSLSSGARWTLLLTPIIVSRLLRPFDDRLWAQVALAVLVALVVLSWSIEPVMNAVLLTSSYARNLLPRATKLATYAFLLYLAAAALSVLVGLTVDSNAALIYAGCLVLWSISAGQTHLVDISRRKIAVRLQGVGALIAAATAIAIALDPAFPNAVLPVFFLFGLAMLWFAAFA